LEGDPEPVSPVTGPGRKFALPPMVIEPALPASEDLLDWEQDYGLGRLWLAARDLHTLHATWDLTPAQAAAAGESLALRVYAGREPAGPFREVTLARSARSVFVPAEGAGQWFVAEIGFTDPAGAWQVLARSVPAHTPALVSAEAREPEFVMLTLPPEPAAAPVFAVPPTAPEPGLARREAAWPEPAPAQTPAQVPVAPPAVPAAPPTALVALVAAAPRPEPPPAALPPAQPPPPAPAAAAFPEAAPPAAPGLEPGVVPAPPAFRPPLVEPTLSATALAPRLARVAGPPWTPAQASEMATLVEAFSFGPGLSSLELAGLGRIPVRPGPGVPAVPSSPAEGFGPAPEAAEAPSSAALARPAGEARRGFWFNINAELIVYGATEPDATVTVDDLPVALRPDGTFTLRFALPDGEYALRAEAAAAGGHDARRARLEFVRRTHYHGAVGQHPTDPALRPPAAPEATA
jgi:hypothetical protein